MLHEKVIKEVEGRKIAMSMVSWLLHTALHDQYIMNRPELLGTGSAGSRIRKDPPTSYPKYRMLTPLPTRETQDCVLVLLQSLWKGFLLV